MPTHTLRKPIPAGRARQKQRNVLAIGIAIAVILVVFFSILLIS